MSQRADRPGHASVDPWDQSMTPGRRASTLRWLWPLAAGLVIVALAATLWLRMPETAPLQAAVALALLVPAVLLPVHLLSRKRRCTNPASSHPSDDADPQPGTPSAFNALGFNAPASGADSALGEADRRWQARAELSADWFWEADRQHRLSWLSSAAAQALAPGLDGAVLLGRRLDQIGLLRAPEQGWAALHGHMTRLESLREIEFQVGAPGRPPHWISISGRPRHNAQGAVIGYAGVGRDVSEMRRAHEQLLASEQRWSTMARLAVDWYWQTDAEHRLLPLDREQQQRIGAELAERIEGRTRWDAHRESLSQAQWAEHRADLDARRPFRSLQFEIDAGGGRWLWISISGMPRHDAAGRFIGYHGVGRDITSRQQAQALLLRHNEALQRAVDERTRDLQQLNLDLDAFARQLAHELRTPIGQVQGLAQMLAERGATRLQAEDQELLQLQVQAAQRMRETLDALLALARSTLQPMPLQTLDLSALAHEVVGELPPLARRAPLRWHIQLEMRVSANPAALKIVLLNLLGNAAKFTRDCSAPRARIGLRADDSGQLRISVQDNGVGFDPARAGQLFKPFARLHAREDYAGSGIGLSIVQRIVERHGGRVEATAEAGRGACFEFTLPATVAQSTPIPQRLAATETSV